MDVRRTTGGLAVLLLLAACGSGSGSGETAAEPSPEEVVCFNGSYEPAEEGEVVPRDEACPQDGASPSPATSPAASWDVGAALLTPQAAEQFSPGDWAVLAGAEPEPGPLLDPCGAQAFPHADDVAAIVERALGWQEEASGAEVLQEVFRYASVEVAEQAFEDYAAAVERCPELQGEGEAQGSSVQHAVVRQDEAAGVQRLLVRRQPCSSGGCTAYFGSYYVVAQAGDGLTAAHYGIYEDGDPAEDAPLFVAAVAEQLSAAVRE